MPEDVGTLTPQFIKSRVDVFEAFWGKNTVDSAFRRISVTGRFLDNISSKSKSFTATSALSTAPSDTLLALPCLASKDVDCNTTAKSSNGVEANWPLVGQNGSSSVVTVYVF